MLLPASLRHEGLLAQENARLDRPGVGASVQGFAPQRSSLADGRAQFQRRKRGRLRSAECYSMVYQEIATPHAGFGTEHCTSVPTAQGIPRSARHQAHVTSGTAAHSRRECSRPGWCPAWARRGRFSMNLQHNLFRRSWDVPCVIALQQIFLADRTALTHQPYREWKSQARRCPRSPAAPCQMPRNSLAQHTDADVRDTDTT